MPMGYGKHPGENTTYKGSAGSNGGSGLADSSTMSAKAKDKPLSKDIEDTRAETGGKDYVYVPSWQKGFRLKPPRDYPGQQTDESYMRQAGRAYASQADKVQGVSGYAKSTFDYLASPTYREIKKREESAKKIRPISKKVSPETLGPGSR